MKEILSVGGTQHLNTTTTTAAAAAAARVQ